MIARLHRSNDMNVLRPISRPNHVSASGATPLAIGVPSFVGEVSLPVAVLSVVAYLLFFHTSFPQVVKFLVVGMIAGPQALGLVATIDAVHGLVEASALLLFFLVGARFNLSQLLCARPLLKAGALQLSVCALVPALLMMLFGVGWRSALFTGLLIALGSAAAEGPLRASRSQKTENGALRSMLRIQHVLVLPLLLLIPFIGRGEGGFLSIVNTFFVGAGFVLLALVVSPLWVPHWLKRIATRRGPVGLGVAVLTLCLGVALAALLVELGLAIGAFLAGQMLSRSRYHDRQLCEAVPLQMIASGFFFVSVGMLFDIRFVSSYPLPILSIAAAILLYKAFVAGRSMAPLSTSAETTALTSFALVPIGELSFLLFYTGREAGLSPGGAGLEGEQAFVAVSVLLLLLSPLASAMMPILRQYRSRRKPSKSLTPPLRRSAARDAEIRILSATGMLAEHIFFSEAELRTLLCTCDGTCSSRQREPLVATRRASEQDPRISIVAVEEGAPAQGFTLGELALWRRLGVIPLAVWRRDVCFVGDIDTLILRPDDQVALSTCPDRLAISTHLFTRHPLALG